jgi:DNA polymerase-3 subunit beta
MKIKVDRAELASALTWVHGGLPKRAVVPVLSAMRLTVVSHTLTLAVFDYERSTRGWLSGGDAEDGQILVDGRVLKRVVGSLPKGKRGTAELTADDQALTITSKGNQWALPAIPADEYPRLPALPPAAGVVDGEAFARSVTRVAAAAARDDKQPLLTCLEITTHETALALAATDTYRLATDRLPWMSADHGAERRQALVPALAATAFAKQAGQYGNVAVHLSDDFAAFRDDARDLTIHTVRGSYAKFRRLLRADSPVSMTADARELTTVLDRMGKRTARHRASSGAWGAVDLRYADHAVSVTALDGDGTLSATESLPAETTGAEEFEVRLNPGYLASLLAGIDGQVVIGLTGVLPDNPGAAMINAAGNDPFAGALVTMKKATASAVSGA